MKRKLLILFIIVIMIGSVKANLLSFNFNTSIENDNSVSSNEIIRSKELLIQLNTDKETTCKYSTIKGKSYSNMEGNFEYDYNTMHKMTLIDLNGGIYRYYIKCKDKSNVESKELEIVFSVDLGVTGKITIKNGDVLKEGKIEVNLVTSKIVSQTPILSYSLDGGSYINIPLIGEKTEWKGYFIIQKLEEEKVGSFKFSAKDLEGNTGTQISEGELFIVDSVKPETIYDIRAIGKEGRIELSWIIDEDLNNFNLYRSTSPNVQRSDFYKSVNSKSYVDINVERGKTYYYKVAGVDEAENEADLSFEVYATVLLENTTIIPSGLDPRFYGIIDSMINEIDLTIEDSESIKDKFGLKSDNERVLYNDFKLEREIDSGINELDLLKKEINNYKSQNLDKNEIDKKLNNAKLKLNTIKKKIPEDLTLVEEKSLDKAYNEEDLTKLILNLDPAIENSYLNKKLKMSSEFIKTKGYKVKIEGKNLDVSYLDGSKKKFSLIKEKIGGLIEKNENITIIEFIPSSIEEKVANINIKNVNYEILKDEGIISFNSDTKEIAYSIEKYTDLNSLDEIKTLLLLDIGQVQSKSSITGYFSYIDFKNNSYFGVIVGIIVLSLLFAYLHLDRRKRAIEERLFPLRKRIHHTREKIIEGLKDDAQKAYNLISQEYNSLGNKEKRIIYGEIEDLYKKFNGR